jgi:hypothetical protein
MGSVMPPALGGLIFWLYLFFFDTTPTYSPEWASRNVIALISGGYFTILISTIIFVIPSLFYSLLMEFVVQKINNNILVIVISMLLGACIAGVFGFNARLIGCVVGLIVGYYLRWRLNFNKLSSKSSSTKLTHHSSGTG